LIIRKVMEVGKIQKKNGTCFRVIFTKKKNIYFGRLFSDVWLEEFYKICLYARPSVLTLRP